MNLGINQGVIVEFQLSSSQYATVAMREFMQCAPRNAPGSKKEAVCKAMLADGKEGERGNRKANSLCFLEPCELIYAKIQKFTMCHIYVYI